jgi:serine/threonine-protein kinase
MPTTLEHAYPRPGDVLEGKYAVERLVGEGAMGAVFQATHVLRQAPVALKFMSPSIIDTPVVVERFLNEGVAASRINNEHVVHVLDVSKLPSGLPYLVMEYLEGENLEQLLDREGKPGLVDVARCVHFVLQVLRALSVAHRSGIIHRDLKPANCFVIRRDDEPDFIKILDFGISKVQPVRVREGTEPGIVSDPLNLTGIGAALGTPLYVSPEQARNPKNVDARSDLYSVAVMLYELLTGTTPFAPESGALSELFMLLATATPAPVDQIRGDLPIGLAAVVSRGLGKSPDQRYQSSAEMAAALAPFADRRSELVLRQLLQRPSAPAGRVTSSPPTMSLPPVARLSSRAQSLPAGTDVASRAQGGATRQGWPSVPAASGTAPGVGSADSQETPSAAAVARGVTRRVWLALLGFGALAAGVMVWVARTDSGEVELGQSEPKRAGADISGPAGGASAARGGEAAQVEGSTAAATTAPLVGIGDAGAAPTTSGRRQVGTRAARAVGTGEVQPADDRKPPRAGPSKLRLRDIGRDRGSGGR